MLGKVLACLAVFVTLWLAPVFIVWTVVSAFNGFFVGFGPTGIGFIVLQFWLTLGVLVVALLDEDNT